MMQRRCSIAWVVSILSSVVVQAQLPTPDHIAEKTCFQTASPWCRSPHVRSDVAIVYGQLNVSFEERVRGWRSRIWHALHDRHRRGDYQDYFTGKFDGASSTRTARWRETADHLARQRCPLRGAVRRLSRLHQIARQTEPSTRASPPSTSKSPKSWTRWIQ